MPSPLRPLATATVESLDTQKQIALGALFQGETHQHAATRANVTRVTLWRWLKYDPEFATLYAAWKQELHESAHARLLKSADGAVTAVTQAVAKGDPKIAMALLRELGILKPRKRRANRRPSPAPAAAPAQLPPPAPPADGPQA